MTDKILFTGGAHVVGGSNGSARSSDGSLDLPLPAPHPAAEHLFAAAWSACFLGALGVAAGQRKIRLTETPEVDAELDLLQGANGFFLRARLDVSVPGLDRETAQALIEAADLICPYSKAVRGNIEVELTLA